MLARTPREGVPEMSITFDKTIPILRIFDVPKAKAFGTPPIFYVNPRAPAPR